MIEPNMLERTGDGRVLLVGRDVQLLHKHLPLFNPVQTLLQVVALLDGGSRIVVSAVSHVRRRGQLPVVHDAVQLVGEQLLDGLVENVDRLLEFVLERSRRVVRRRGGQQRCAVCGTDPIEKIFDETFDDIGIEHERA